MARKRALEDIMEIDHVIRVNPDGTITESVPGVYAPDLLMATADDDCGSILAGHEADYIAQAERQGWCLERGWTGQYGYSGLAMHPSEYIGGDLEEHILKTPGLWVAITIETDRSVGDDDPDEPVGWAVAYRES